MLYKLALITASLALVLGACSDSTTIVTEVQPSSTGAGSSTPATTVDPDQAVIFGSGSLPETMPADLPIPVEAVIGSTLIDRNRSLTEVILRVPASVVALGAFFDANLPGRGYTVGSSAGDDDRWDIEFSNDDLTGTIAIIFGDEDVSQAVITVISGS